MSELTSAISSAFSGAASAATGGILGPVLQIIDKIIPDPAAKAQAQLAVLQLQQSGALAEYQGAVQQTLAQTQVDQAEASSGNWFEADWRPFAGWICGLGLLYSFLLQPLAAWISPAWKLAPPPVLDTGTLIPLLLGMLGLGAIKMNENIQSSK